MAPSKRSTGSAQGGVASTKSMLSASSVPAKELTMTPSCTEGTDEQQYLELLNEFSLELELLNANRRQTSEDFDQQSQHLNQQIEHLEQQIASRSVSEQQCLELLIEVRLEIVLRNANLRQIIEDFEQQIEPFEQQIGHLKQQIESLSVAHQSTKK